jgi:hypothetical protein
VPEDVRVRAGRDNVTVDPTAIPWVRLVAAATAAGDQLDLRAGGCEDGAVAITEGDRTPKGRCAVIPRRTPPRR